MSALAKRAAYAVASAVGAPALLRRRGAGPVLCYHNIVARGGAAGDRALHLEVDAFERQLAHLGAAYDLVPLADYVERLRAPAGARGLAVLTFDDAYAGVLAHALPRLAARAVPCTIFVVADAPGRADAFWWDDAWIDDEVRQTRRDAWLGPLEGRAERIRQADAHGVPPGPRPADAMPATWEALAAVAGPLVTLGVHSASHACLASIAPDAFDVEIAGARRTLGARLPGAFDQFAYPYGRWNPAARDAVARSGHRIAVTLDSGRNSGTTDPLAIRRLNVPASIPLPAFKLWAAGGRPGR